MKIEVLNDGTKIVTYTPMQGMPFFGDWLDILLQRGAAFLAPKVDKLTGKTVFDAEGKPEMTTVMLDRNQEQRAVMLDENRVAVVCIGCGEPFEGTGPLAVKRTAKTARFDDRIRIGGFIQFKHEVMVGPKEIHKQWRVQPTYKMGLGCPNCRQLFAEQVAITNRANEERAAYAALVADVHVNGIEAQRIRAEEVAKIKEAVHIRCLHGLSKPYCAVCNRGYKKSVIEVKLPAELTPFIDVFAKRDAMGPVVE